MIYIYFFILTLSLFLIVLTIKNKKFFEKLNKDYNPVQKIHHGYIPRVGGLIIILCFYTALILINDFSIFLKTELILAAILIIFVGAIEDLFGKASPFLRFFSIFIASLIFVSCQNQLPVIDITFLNSALKSHYFVEILFYTIGLTALANGFNMIDGMNGLVGFTSVGCLLSTLAISIFFINSDIYHNEIILLISLLCIFLFFNFPNGKIFFGDTGSYWIGWIIGILIIKLYSEFDLNTWGAIIILFYPLQEVVFSVTRKLFQKKSPLNPDIEHLHLKLYFFLKGQVTRSTRFNSFVTVCLMPFWFLPTLMIVWSQIYSHIIIVFIFILEAAYLYFYYLIPSK